MRILNHIAAGILCIAACQLAACQLAGAGNGINPIREPTNDLEREAYIAGKFVAKAMDDLQVIAVCDLRSEAWLNRLRTGMLFGILANGDKLKRRAQDKQVFTAYQDSIELWVGKHGAVIRLIDNDMAKTCAAMFGSDTIKKLDELDRYATGDYH